ncbi:MAG: hypothetical protein IKU24_04720 [Clostridia bacterium]|nr:hypothetical protein [Clostridia bacterium]
MKALFSFLARSVAHLVLILALMMLTFFCIDLVNPSMAFLNNTVTKYLLALFSLFSLILALVFLFREEDRKSERKQNETES